MITDNVKKALEEFAKQITQMEQDPEVIATTKAYNDILAELEDAEIKGNLARARFQSRIAELVEYIAVQALEIATSFEHAGVKVSYRKGYERVTWVRKAMDDICLKNPALLSLLAPARKVTPVEPSVSVAILEFDKEPKEIE